MRPLNPCRAPGRPGPARRSVRRRASGYAALDAAAGSAVRRLRARGVGPTWFCDGSDAALPLLARAGIPGKFIVDVRDHPLLPGEHATEQWRRLAQITPDAVAGTAAAGWPAPESRDAELAAVTPGCHLEV